MRPPRRVPNRRALWRGARCARASVSRGARSGAQASLVTSPAQTRSHSASWISSGDSASSASRSVKKHGAASSRSRMRSCAGSVGGSAPRGPAGRPIASASSRKYSATRPVVRPSAPAPTQTTSPDAQSWSSHVGEYAPMRRGSTSRSHTSAGSASPCSGTSTSRRRSIPAPAAGWRSTPCHDGRNAASARWSAASISLRSAASDARRRRRSTSVSHHSRSVPPGRSSPRTTAPSRSSAGARAVGSTP